MNVRVTISEEQIEEIIRQKQGGDVKDKVLDYLYDNIATLQRKSYEVEWRIRDAEEILKNDNSTRGEIKSANYSLGNTRASARIYEGELRAYNKMIEYIQKL